MSHYRRAKSPGACYFFTVVTYRRQTILCDEPVRVALREAIKHVQSRKPFVIDAWILLPDHLHCIWTLPESDNDFPTRWSAIKRRVSLLCGNQYMRSEWLTESKKKHRESTLWQRRFWEHQIRNPEDYNRHMDYIHYNPVKHGLCDAPADWPYSTFHRCVKEGVYPKGWAANVTTFEKCKFGE